MTTIDPGHYPDMSNETYQASDAESKSRLDTIADAPIHYWAKYIDPDREPETKTEALILGDAIHKAILEPDLLTACFIAVPEDAPKRPSSAQLNAKNPSADSVAAMQWWAGFNAEHANKTVLSAEQFKTVMRTRDSAYRDPLIRGLMNLPGVAEQSYFAIDPETGLSVKCRPDWMVLENGLIVDVKSTEDASPDGFAKSVENYRYYVQDPWYKDVIALHCGGQAIEHFAFLAIEKKWPNATGVHYLTADDIADGRAAARQNLRRIAECRSANHWPSYREEATPIRRPNWAKRTIRPHQPIAA
jgi:exodeoxyribonuclease VIII